MSTVGTVLIQFRNVRIVAEGAADVTFQSHTIQGADPLSGDGTVRVGWGRSS